MTLYSVQGVKTSNTYFIIPRHYTVYKGSKHQTNTLLSPDTIQCTRGQNIKQILYYPQTLYSVQGVKTSNKILYYPQTLYSVQGVKTSNKILYYPQTLYSVQGVPRHYTVYKGSKHQTKYFIIPRHYTVYKGSKHQTKYFQTTVYNQNIKQIHSSQTFTT